MIIAYMMVKMKTSAFLVKIYGIALSENNEV